jgi:hypothetical protein
LGLTLLNHQIRIAPTTTTNKIVSDARRFPPPCSVEELDACFAVTDGAGQKLAYVYFEDEPGRRSAAKLPTKDETRRIAVNFAKLPDLVGKAHRGEDEATH